jgi:hypothetical protein
MELRSVRGTETGTTRELDISRWLQGEWSHFTTAT